VAQIKKFRLNFLLSDHLHSCRSTGKYTLRKPQIILRETCNY